MSMMDALKALGNPMEMMRKAREMQEKMQQVQAELARQSVTADAGGGLVTAEVNGKMQVVKIRIDKTKFNPADVELLEDVVTAAIAAAQAKAADLMQRHMQKMAADAGMPTGMLPGM
jgi:DNA-binding YbaB/EbfC family protein